MSHAGTGGAGHFQVSLTGLEAASGHAARICLELLNSVRGQANGLKPAGQHGGWAISAALSRCAAGWQSELTLAADTVRDVGDRLASTVENYRTTEQTNTTRLRDIRLPGGTS